MSVTIDYTTQTDLDEDFENYVTVALSTYVGGISKGTANVSPHDIKKLHGLLDHYKKMPHPFTACVRDNRKRFGPLTEKYCAVLKDLIVGNTDWRSNKKKKRLSETTLQELYAVDVPDGFLEYLSELTDEDLVELTDGEKQEEETALADVIWNPYESTNYLRDKIDASLNVGKEPYSMEYWVRDINTNDNKALVCEHGDSYYVVEFNVDKSGDVTLADEKDWTPVEQAWVDSNSAYLAEDAIVAEVYLHAPEIEEKDGLIWKTIAREGTWKYSPEAGTQIPVPKPLTFTRSGVSSWGKDNYVASIEELKSNFDDGAIDHVSVPISHKDLPNENTGWVKELRIEDDEDGKALLKAGIEFTEPDIKDKVLRGSIANISSGIKWGYIKKDTGKKYGAVVDHTALTNKPWLNGMKPFGLGDSDNTNILAFSEQEGAELSEETTNQPQGGDEVEVTDEKPTFLSELGISEDEAKARLAEYNTLKEEQKKTKVDERCRAWQEKGVTPALVLAAKSILEADEGVAILNLSENGSTKTLTASDIVDRLIEAAPVTELTETKVTEKDLEGEKPKVDTKDENDEANLTLSEKSLIAELYFKGMSKEDAIKEAKKRLASEK